MHQTIKVFLLCLALTSCASAEAAGQQGTYEESGSGGEDSALNVGVLKVSEGVASSRMFASLDRILGPGGKVNGIQSFAFDERNQELYSLNLNIAKDGNRSTVNRYPLHGGESKSSQGFTKPLGSVVGHQGLGLEYLESGGIRLWSTYYKDLRQVARYSYSDGMPVGDVQVYRLFGPEYRSYVSATPTISLDQKYLIAAGKKKGVDYQTLRVWRIADLIKEKGGDVSQTWVYEWDVKGVIGRDYPLQGIASDGSRVWIIAGNNKIDVPKRMVVYSLRGKRLDSDFNVDVGRQQAMLDGSGKVYEPEGLAMLRVDGQVFLCVGIVSGDRGQRYARIYKVPVQR
ncbi:hypothetical protein [Pseudomonas putida]|uniref:phage baseplate protein n=1 Tax=Pseudomonas putida TaxID=303 RepID=UPI00383A9827